MSRILLARICAAAAVVPLIAALGPAAAHAAPTSVACQGVCGPSTDPDDGFYGDPDPRPVTGQQYIKTTEDDNGGIVFAYCEGNDSFVSGGYHFAADADNDAVVDAQHPVGTGSPTSDDPPHGWSVHWRADTNAGGSETDTIVVYALCKDDSFPRHDFS